MKTIHEITRILNNIQNAISSRDVKKIKGNLKLLNKASTIISKFLFRHDVSIFEKEKIMIVLNETCKKTAEIFHKILQDYFYSFLPLLIETLGKLYLVGCTRIFDKLFNELVSKAKLNPNAMAYIADKLLECGCTDLASIILNELLRLRYNLPAVLINLAIASYMTGKPRESQRYVHLYEKITQKKLRLKASLSIVLGEIEKFRSL